MLYGSRFQIYISSLYLFSVESLCTRTPWPLSLYQRLFLDFFNLTIACDMFDFHRGHVTYVCTLYYFSRTLGKIFIELFKLISIFMD